MLSPTSSAFRSGGDHARIIQGPILVLKRALQQIIDQWTYYYLLSSVFFCMCQPKWLLLLLLCQYTSISSKPKTTLLSLQRFFLALWSHSLNTILETPSPIGTRAGDYGPFANLSLAMQCLFNYIFVLIIHWQLLFHRLASLISLSMVNTK